MHWSTRGRKRAPTRCIANDGGSAFKRISEYLYGGPDRDSKELREYCDMDSGTKDLLKAAIAQFLLTGRGYDRILKVSRTIANLVDAPQIEMHHVAEAINYWAFDRKLFG